MRLTEEQLESYRRNGFLVLENYFSEDELEILKDELPSIFGEDSPRRVLERSGAVRTVFASHLTNPVFQCLSRMERLVGPARQMLDGEVYIHQFKINAKVALEGDQWEWHQDFLYWHKEDRMPAPRALTAAIFLQEVNEFNGPMLVIPGSHRDGMIDVETHEKYLALQGNGNGNGNGSGSGNGHGKAEAPTTWAATLTADLKYKINREILSRLMSERNIRAVTVPAGSVLFFHSNTFHASANNLSPWDRISVFVSYNSVENALRPHETPRPDFIASRDFRAVEPIEDAALVELGVAV